MVLAYALALQAIFAAGVGAQHAAAASSSHDLAVICFGVAGSQTDTDGAPSKRLHHAPCALCSVAAVAADVPTAATTLVHPAAAHPVAYAAAAHPDADPARPHSPRLSQGPPKIT